jgi:hypothetical protein
MMLQEQIYRQATKTLEEMAQVPLARFRLHEALFLFTKCKYHERGSTIVSAFDEDDLRRLSEIHTRVTAS